MKVSYYKDSFDTHGVTANLSTILKNIKTGKWAEEVEIIRSTKVKEERDKIKGELPSFITSGIFQPTRGMHNCTDFTSMMILDIDLYRLEKQGDSVKRKRQYTLLSEVVHEIVHDPHTYCSFISPGGKGLKIIVKLGEIIHFDNDEVLDQGDLWHFKENAIDIYRHSFLEIAKYYWEKYNVELDRSGKNINRICYVSHDGDLYQNKDSVPFSGFFRSHKMNIGTVDYDPKNFKEVGVYDRMEYAVACIEKRGNTFSEGNRNNYLFYLSCTLNRFGVYFEDALSLVNLWFGLPMEAETEWYKCIRSAYVSNRREFNRYPVLKQIRKK